MTVIDGVTNEVVVDASDLRPSTSADKTAIRTLPSGASLLVGGDNHPEPVARRPPGIRHVFECQVIGLGPDRPNTAWGRLA